MNSTRDADDAGARHIQVVELATLTRNWVEAASPREVARIVAM